MFSTGVFAWRMFVIVTVRLVLLLLSLAPGRQGSHLQTWSIECGRSVSSWEGTELGPEATEEDAFRRADGWCDFDGAFESRDLVNLRSGTKDADGTELTEMMPEYPLRDDSDDGEDDSDNGGMESAPDGVNVDDFFITPDKNEGVQTAETSHSPAVVPPERLEQEEQVPTPGSPPIPMERGETGTVSSTVASRIIVDVASPSFAAPHDVANTGRVRIRILAHPKEPQWPPNDAASVPKLNAQYNAVDAKYAASIDGARSRTTPKPQRYAARVFNPDAQDNTRNANYVVYAPRRSRMDKTSQEKERRKQLGDGIEELRRLLPVLRDKPTMVNILKTALQHIRDLKERIEQLEGMPTVDPSQPSTTMGGGKIESD